MDPGMDGLETYRRILEIRPVSGGHRQRFFGNGPRAQPRPWGPGLREKALWLEKLGMAIRRELNR